MYMGNMDVKLILSLYITDFIPHQVSEIEIPTTIKFMNAASESTQFWAHENSAVL